MPQVQPKATGQSKLRANEKKWGKTLCDAGWTLIPSTILERQQALGLDAVDMNILLQIARHWWQKDNPPHPSIRTIAECIGKSVSTVQRRVTKLKKRGVISITHRKNNHGGQTSSSYFFTGLIEKATEFAKETLQDREENRQNSAARRRRMIPRAANTKGLKIVR